MLEALTYTTKQFDIYEAYNVDQYLTAYGLCSILNKDAGESRQQCQKLERQSWKLSEDAQLHQCREFQSMDRWRDGKGWIKDNRNYVLFILDSINLFWNTGVRLKLFKLN